MSGHFVSMPRPLVLGRRLSRPVFSPVRPAARHAAFPASVEGANVQPSEFLLDTLRQPAYPATSSNRADTDHAQPASHRSASPPLPSLPLRPPPGRTRPGLFLKPRLNPAA